jgi:peptidoglycan/LPS O-acetylase OafA/YrhL
MSNSLRHTTKYRPEIDGLRAIAVLPVVLFHAGLGCPGGYIGVDIFFVISGFLITSIIQKQLRNGTFVMSRFWEKRIRRILPALAVVILFTIAGASFSFYPSAFEDFGKELIAQSSLISNFYFWQQDGYFAAPSESQALLHTWSLAVEEQFYFVFPFILTWLFTRKNSSEKKTLLSISLILAASLIWSCIGVYKYPTATFFLLPARAWEMMLGAFIALYIPQKSWSHTINSLISWISLSTIFYCIYKYDSTVPFPGIAALAPCLATVALIFCNQSKLTTPAKFLSLRPVVFVGKISYSFYLWHWPIIVFANYTAVDTMSDGTRWGLVTASFIMAVLSWRFIETPFRTSSFTRQQVFRAFYISTALFILSGLVIYKGDGWQQRLPDEVIKLAAVGDERIKIKKSDNPDELSTIPFSDKKGPTLPMLLWGDSHAIYSSPAFEKLCNDHNSSIYVAAQSSTPPILNTTGTRHANMEEHNNSAFEFIKQKQIKDVILVSRWAAYAQVTGNNNTPSLIDTSNPSLSAQQTFELRLTETVRRINESGAHVWILKQVPLQEEHAPLIMANSKRFGYDSSEGGVPLAHHRKRQKFVNSVFDSLPTANVTILDPTDIFLSEKGICRFSTDGQPLYRDSDHLSRYGALKIAPLFEPIFE